MTGVGWGSGLLVDPERDRFLATVREGLDDADQGRVTEDHALTELLDRRFGVLNAAE